jgi:hypothetical protein
MFDMSAYATMLIGHGIAYLMDILDSLESSGLLELVKSYNVFLKGYCCINR